METYQASLTDEIALEGLDGITLEGLWKRLEKRPKFEMILDEKSKEFLWKLVKKLNGIEIYELEEPRLPLLIFNRFDYMDPESGLLYEPNTENPNIYPHWPIDDHDTNIMGSCSTYYSRKICTSEAVKLNLQEVDEKYGNKLILVASQTLRNAALTGSRYLPMKNIVILTYCLLERIGRSRYHGEVTQGKYSLQNMLHEEAKNLFYHRLSLSKYKLITKQLFYQKTGLTNCTGTLIHLTRFYVEKKPRTIFLMEQLILFLKTRRHFMARYDELTEYFGVLSETFKKLIKNPEWQIYFNTNVKVPYRKMYPEAKPQEWMTKNSEKEKTIRVVQLNNPDMDLRDIWTKNQEEIEDVDDDHVENNSSYQWSVNIPLLNQAYKVVAQSGPNGTHKTEMQTLLGVNKLQSRALFKNLIRRGVVYSYAKDQGRQRVSYIVANKYQNNNKRSREFTKELDKMRALLDKNDKRLEIQEDLQEPKPKRVKFDLENNSTCDNKEQIQTNYVDMQKVLEQRLGGIGEGLTTKLFLKEEESNVSLRILRRANLIINEVKEHQVIYDLVKLLNLIKDKESKEGVDVTIDKRSLLRLLSKLSKDGHIKLIEIRIKSPSREKSLSFVCEPNVTIQHSVIQSAIDHAKIKFSSMSRVNIKKSITNFTDSYIEGRSPKDKQDLEKVPLKYEKSIGKKYGYLPKFMRMQVLHEFIFYVLYGYEGQNDLDQNMIKQNFLLNGSQPEENMPKAYTTDLNFKTFVPPMVPHLGWPTGWILLGDIIIRIPISVLLKCFNVVYHIPRLQEYIDDPIKKNYLLKHIPEEIRNAILMKRKYITSLYEVLVRLCYIGLIQFGPHKIKDKDQIFFYLNKNAILYNTIKSLPGYHQISIDVDYPELNFKFQSLHDIKKYWEEMWNICLNTKLGGRLSINGKDVYYELNLHHKPELVAALQPRKPEEAPFLDMGVMPGDHKGAAGIDSGLFPHLKRNWDSGVPMEEEEFDEKIKLARAKAAASRIAESLKKDDKMSRLRLQLLPNQTNQILNKKTQKRRKSDNTKMMVTPKKKPEIKTRLKKIGSSKKQKPKPSYKNYLDEKDKRALQLMSKLRVDWSQPEDNLLLLCKVASLYISPNPRQFSINTMHIRDVLHEFNPISENKTSRACQRRIVYMLKNKATVHSVVLHLEEIRQDPQFKEKFGNVLSKLKSLNLSPQEFDEHIKERFKELVCSIKNKLGRSHEYEKTKIGIIPDTITEFYKKYTLLIPDFNSLNHHSRFTPTKSIDDIHCGVISSVVHSSLGCIADKTNFSYHLLHIYQQYPDNLIRSVFTRICQDQMVKKNNKKVIKIHGNYITTPYRFSIGYLYMLQTKYNYSIFHENYLNLKILNHEKFNFQLEELSGGTVCCLIELNAMGLIEVNIELPDHLIAFDLRLTDKVEYQKIYEILGQETGGSEIANLNNQPITGRAATRLAVYLMRKDGFNKFSGDKQHAHDVLVVNSCKVSTSIYNQINLHEILPKSKVAEVLNNIRSQIIIPPFIKLLSNNEIVKDFDEDIQQFAIDIQNYLKTKGELGATLKELRERFNDSRLAKTLHALKKIHAVLRSGVTTFHYIHREHTKPWLVHSYKIKRSEREEHLNSLKYSNKLDVLKCLKYSKKDLAEKTQDESSSSITNSKSNNNEIIQLDTSGSTSINTPIGENNENENNLKISDDEAMEVDENNICNQGPKEIIDENNTTLKNETSRLRERRTKKEIIIESGNMIFKNSEQIQVSIRPWVRVDGTLNRRVLDRLLSSLLGHLMLYPGNTIAQLTERFSPALQPMQVRDLLEILESIECVSIIKIIRNRPVTLFTKMQQIEIAQADGTEDESSLAIEVNPNAATKLGLFIGDKTYSTDFLTNESFNQQR